MSIKLAVPETNMITLKPRISVIGVGGGGGGAVGAENVGLIGDAEGLELLAGTLYNGPVRVASHNDCYFFHAILLKKIKMQIKKG